MSIICVALTTLPTTKEEGYVFSTKQHWHYCQEDSDPKKRAVDLLDWESALTDLDVNEQVFV